MSRLNFKVFFLKNFPSVFLTSGLIFLFGLFLLISVVSPGDGGWILYGREISKGAKLYSDLNFNQQPIFPIISAFVASITDNILYHHLLYLPVLIFFITSLVLISKEVEENFHLRSLLMATIFFVAISFEAYRFDDYHALAQSGVLFAVALTIHKISKDDQRVIKFFFIQGILFGIVLLIRVNEGLVIMAGLLITGLFLSSSIVKFIQGILIFTLAFSLVLITVLLLIGESPFTWFDFTFLRALGNKGGTSVFTYPYRLILNSISSLYDNFNALSPFKKRVIVIYILFFCGLTFITQKAFIKYLYGLLGLIIASYYLHETGRILLQLLIPLFVLILFFSSPLSLLSVIFIKKRICKYVFIVSVYPMALFFLGSLSSAGRFQDLTFPSAALIAIIPIVFNKKIVGKILPDWIKYLFYSVLAILVVEGFYQRNSIPYAWHSYKVPPLLSSEYEIVRQPMVGNVILSNDVAKLVLPVCEIVPQGASLISMPFSFANYFCGIPVWHGYVQSFYDTAGPVLIGQIVNDLKSSPPDYIFYQRQLLNLSIHESLFNGGNPLPHRNIDDLIMSKIKSGDWKIVYRSPLFPPSDWILIRTIK